MQEQIFQFYVVGLICLFEFNQFCLVNLKKTAMKSLAEAWKILVSDPIMQLFFLFTLNSFYNLFSLLEDQLNNFGMQPMCSNTPCHEIVGAIEKEFHDSLCISGG